MMSLLARYFSLAMILASIFALSIQPAVSAVDPSKWKAGNIIDDPTFTDKNAMSVAEIQAFLNSKVPQCDTWGQKTSPYWAPDYNGDGRTSRAEYGQYRNNPTPFTCLKDYREVPKAVPGGGIPPNNYGNVNGTNPSGSKSAAEIIWQAAQDFNISPKTLLVTLQKESGLLTDDWTFKSQLVYAMGAHCPDTGPGGSANCDPNYGGFSLQIRESADLMRYYLDNMQQDWWRQKRPYQHNYIGYDVEDSCGGTNIYMENKATTALYIYTPYQPSEAALNAGYGSAEPCGAYGNRNFWLYFNDWFGNTSIRFVSLDNPRWMRIINATYKVDLSTMERVSGTSLSTHQQIKFVDKVQLDGVWYLRTEHDSKDNRLQGVPQPEVEEIPFETLVEPTWMTLVDNGNKSFPSSRKYAAPIQAGTSIKFTQKINIGSTTYYRSEFDTVNNNNVGIISSQLSEFQFIPLSVPTYMHTNSSTSKVNVLTYASHSTVPQDTSLKIEGKTLINGIWYYQELGDYNAKNNLAFKSSYISRNDKVTLGREITITLPKLLYKSNLHNLSDITSNPLQKDKKILISHSIMVNGDLYYITKFDHQENNYQGIKASDLFISLDVPREYYAISATNKLRLSDISLSDNITKDQRIYFSTKISLDGEWCLRSLFDTEANNLLCVPIRYVK